MIPLHHRLSTTYAVAALALAVAVGTPSALGAQSATELVQVLEAMKQLEARVAALEGENKQAKKETAVARAEAQALRQKLATTTPTVATLVPSGYAMATKVPPIATVPSWAGLYAGASFGLGLMRSSVKESSTTTFKDDFSAPTFSDASTDISNLSGNFSGQTVGAVTNLFLGYNFVLGNNVILGGQLDGGVSNIQANLSGGTTQVTTTTTVVTPPGGPAGTSSSTGVTNDSLSSSIENRWLISVLARSGLLVDPLDLVYVLGGYTYGRFEFGQSFGLNGGTVGAGWERQIAPGWTLKGEYRYTKFQSKDLSSTFVSNTVTTNISGGASSTNTSDVAPSTNRVSADIHSLWVGVSHYFGQ
jgi:opacity protein-like surface antigen